MTFPAPVIVIGVGRFGLAILERLGEDWASLSASGADATIGNLRLVHVRASDGGQGAAWREHERKTVHLASYVGEGDFPAIALDFLILRTIGLVRFRDGSYQLAVPRDQGLVDIADTEGDDRSMHHAHRRRFFEWSALGSDPIVASERLRRLAEGQADVDLFITPILNRVKQGHSPSVILSTIARCKSFAEGRDPSPWPWVRPVEPGQSERTCLECSQGLFDVHGFRRACPKAAAAGAAGDAPGQESRATCPWNWLGTWDGWNLEAEGGRWIRLPVSAAWLTGEDWAPQRRNLEHFAPPPLPGWGLFLDRVREADRRPEGIPIGALPPATDLEIRSPMRFVPNPGDLPSPLDPTHLLWVDWESNGWASEGFDAEAGAGFRPVNASPFRLGLFDHDGSLELPGDQDHATERLRLLATHAHKGLVRQWMDLQRNRVEERTAEGAGDRRRDAADAALRQTLEILGELIVRSLLSDAPASSLSPGGLARRCGADPRDVLPHEPTSALRELDLGQGDSQPSAARLLEERLAAIGLPDEAVAKRFKRGVLSEAALAPYDIPGPADDDWMENDSPNRPGLTRLRSILNGEVRHLYHFEFLSKYRRRPTRQPSRLTVFVVGDVQEPFVRASMRSILRESHAELVRSYGPIFETYREGFDRSLEIVPILWMPNPSDAFEGEYDRDASRCEETAIVDSVHGIRRWLESAPPGKRCISQIFVNSRVTDNAVLNVAEAVRQTRNFITFFIRNDLTQDEWLRRSAVGPKGDDFFSSFACFEIDFPAERAREYLSNRLARDCLGWIRRGDGDGIPDIDASRFAPRPVNQITRAVVEQLHQITDASAGRLADRVRQRVTPGTTPSAQVEDDFGPGFSAELVRDIQKDWLSMTRNQGLMDDMVDTLRGDTSVLLSKTLGEVRETGDELVEHLAVKRGLKVMQAAYNRLRGATRTTFQRLEEERRDSERLCGTHTIPDPRPVDAARTGVVDAARKTPDWTPMKVGLIVFGLMAAVGAAPIAYATSLYFGLFLDPGILEFILGPLAPLVAAALMVPPAFFILRWYRNRAIRRLGQSIEDMADATRRVVHGTGAELAHESPCVRSFFEARLHLTGGLAAKGFAQGVHEQVDGDLKMAHRIHRSIEVQYHLLDRQAQDLGVRPGGASGDRRATEQDDITRLFSPRGAGIVDKLVSPSRLHAYYQDRYSDGSSIRTTARRLVEHAGSFAKWRRTAVLSDTDKVLDFGRNTFEPVVSQSLPELAALSDEAGRELVRFVNRHYPNIGFGAKFVGYEGLDPDGIWKIADAALVVNPALERLYQKARNSPDAAATTDTLQVITSQMRPNAAYMLSLVQGIRAHSVRNLRRFESFHERIRMPDDRTFPLSGDSAGSRGAINLLSGFGQLGQQIKDSVFLPGQRTLATRDGEAARGAGFEAHDGAFTKAGGNGDEQRT